VGSFSRGASRFAGRGPIFFYMVSPYIKYKSKGGPGPRRPPDATGLIVTDIIMRVARTITERRDLVVLADASVLGTGAGRLALRAYRGRTICSSTHLENFKYFFYIRHSYMLVILYYAVRINFFFLLSIDSFN